MPAFPGTEHDLAHIRVIEAANAKYLFQIQIIIFSKYKYLYKYIGYYQYFHSGVCQVTPYSHSLYPYHVSDFLPLARYVTHRCISHMIDM